MMNNLVKFDCPYYEVADLKKDLHLSLNLDSFDESKLSLVPKLLNEETFEVKYDNKKLRLFVKDLYVTVKRDHNNSEAYFTYKYDPSPAKKLLDSVFSSIKKPLIEKVPCDVLSFAKFGKIWLTAAEYDLKIGHSYHVRDLYIAIDNMICCENAFLKTYWLNSVMIDSSVNLCYNCDTFELQEWKNVQNK